MQMASIRPTNDKGRRSPPITRTYIVMIGFHGQRVEVSLQLDDVIRNAEPH